MPNRIIKESITTSEKLASLSDFEFRLWIGLITQADDAGRGDARPAVIKGRVFPFRERLTVKDVGSSLRALADKGCVTLYEIGGRPYFYGRIPETPHITHFTSPQFPCGTVLVNTAASGKPPVLPPV